MKLMHKAMIVALAPILCALGLTIYIVSERTETISTLVRTDKVLKIEPALSLLVHELQRERGRSAGELGTPAGPASAALADQRRATDAALAALTTTLTQTKEELNETSHGNISSVVKDLEQLPSIRRDIVARAIKLPDMAKFYTSKIVRLLAVVDEISREGGSTQTTILTLSQLMRAKENMGLERAMGANGFGRQQFTKPVYNRFVGLQAQQEAYLGNFRRNASSQHVKMLEAVMNDPALNEFKRLRALALANGLGGDLEGVTAGHWFAQITILIDGLREVETQISSDIQAGIADRIRQEQQVATGTIGLIAAMMLVSAAISIYVGRSKISKPIAELSEVCVDLAQDKKIDIPYKDRTDEVGVLASSMNKVYSASLARKRIRAALQSASARLMIISRGEFKYIQPHLLQDLIDASGDVGLAETLQESSRLEAIPLVSKAISAFFKENKSNQGVIESFEFGNRLYDLHVSTALDVDGEDLGVVVEWRDMTETRQIQSAISTLLAEASNGDFSQRIDVTSSDPALATMVSSMNSVCATVDGFIRDLSLSMNAISVGDLSRPVEGRYRGQLGETGENTNKTIANLADLIGVIRDTTNNLNTKASSLRTDSSSLAKRADGQSKALAETSNTMEQITDSVEETAQNARDVDALIIDTQSKVADCHSTMSATVDAINAVEQSSKAISEIIAIIHSISFQTNLLALNAAVEAARAGSAGAGFAVVASEVRALAQRSSDAAKDIDQRINVSSNEINTGVALVEQAGSALATIKSAVDDSVDKISAITRANVEQANNVRGVQSTIREIDDLTKQNVSIAESSAMVAAEIASMSDELTEQAGQFVVNDPGLKSTNVRAA